MYRLLLPYIIHKRQSREEEEETRTWSQYLPPNLPTKSLDKKRPIQKAGKCLPKAGGGIRLSNLSPRTLELLHLLLITQGIWLRRNSESSMIDALNNHHTPSPYPSTADTTASIQHWIRLSGLALTTERDVTRVQSVALKMSRKRRRLLVSPSECWAAFAGGGGDGGDGYKLKLKFL